MLRKFTKQKCYNHAADAIKKLSRTGTIIVITGGIASGKSFIANHFANHGFFSVNLDVIAAKMMQKNGVAYALMQKNFADCFDANLEIDKRLLGNAVFGDTTRMALLQRIMHPIIREEYQCIIDNIAGKRSIVAEIPLVIEALLKEDFRYQCDYIMLVQAEYLTRWKRAAARKYMTKGKFDAIINAQSSDSEKAQYADFTIINETALSALDQVKKATYAMLKRNSIRH